MSLEEHESKLNALAQHCRRYGRDPSQIQVTHNTRVVIAETPPSLTGWPPPVLRTPT